MIYTTGTVNTVSGSAIVKGTGTKFKNNNPAINIGMTILIKSGNTNIPYMIKSVNSDTELVLAQPALATATNTTFSIHITEPDNNSDAARTMVAINSYVEYFLDAMNTWMTQTGQTKIEMPNGEIVTLDSIKKMQGDIQNKADLTKTTPQDFKGGIVSAGAVGSRNSSYDLFLSLDPSPSFLYKINGTYYRTTLPEKTGKMMLVGDYGWGGNAGGSYSMTEDEFTEFITNADNVSQVFRNSIETKYSPRNSTVAHFKTGNLSSIIAAGFGSSNKVIVTGGDAEVGKINVYNLYHNLNTTKDSNGNLKVASPIVKVFADHIELNEESEGVEMAHLGIGHYLIKGVVGFNADGAWGINNGFVIPQDHNGKNMILIDYNVKQDGDIELFVFHQQNADMPERFQNKRIKDFGKDGQPVYFENYEPCDVPESRWIDMRVEMPPNSIYNLKQAEEERLAKEEDKRAAEEIEQVSDI